MAGTDSDRSEEFARIRQAEKNNYYGGQGKGEMKEGFKPKRNAKDPAKASAGTSGPSGR